MRANRREKGWAVFAVFAPMTKVPSNPSASLGSPPIHHLRNMESLSLGARKSLTRIKRFSPCFRYGLNNYKSSISSTPLHGSVRQYVFCPTSSRRTVHERPAVPDSVSSLAGGSSTSQAYPLSGYYSDILYTRSPYRNRATSSRPTVTVAPDKATPATTVEPQSPQDKMSIVFGSRLAGPGYKSSRYNPDTMPPESTWKTISGVAIPPRPVEPDNCCMSGCVHCVWDDYRDDMEEWAGRLEQAKAKAASKEKTTDMRQTRRSEVESAMTSMDDDGGGSETNWSLPSKTDDLFADIPVGIREFMKTEKKLRQKHQDERATA